MNRDEGDNFIQNFIDRERDQKSNTPSTTSNNNAFGAPGQAKDFQSRPQQNQQSFMDNFSASNHRTESPMGISNGSASGNNKANNAQGSGDRQTPIEDMNETARYSLPGLMGQMRSNNSDVRALAVGQDLTTLGLNLNSAEYVTVLVVTSHYQHSFILYSGL